MLNNIKYFRVLNQPRSTTLKSKYCFINTDTVDPKLKLLKVSNTIALKYFAAFYPFIK